MAHTFFVLNENTLVYSFDEKPFDFLKILGVLSQKILSGGHHWMDGNRAFNPGHDKIRPATKEDFEYFGLDLNHYLD